MWAQDAYRKDRLEQALARRMLGKLKKGKVYVIVHPGMESYFAEVGFRYVLKPPASVQAIIEQRMKTADDNGERIAMLYEVSQHKADASLSSRPDLLVIDGGKGQLGVAVEVLRMLELEIPVIGLAKREEDIFLPGESFPVPFPKDSQAKFLLMRLRDEAHRFANRHRERRGARAMKGSILDTVQGIGPETKKILLRQFGSVDRIFAASDDELGRWISSEQITQLRKGFG
jgi:excinuclease UvrABC nuclease subunit